VKRVFALITLLLAAQGCSEKKGPDQRSLWSDDQVKAIESACVETLKEGPTETVKIAPICTCWAGAIARDFTPEESHSNDTVEPIRILLNQCGTDNGLTSPLAFLSGKFRSFLRTAGGLQ